MNKKLISGLLAGTILLATVAGCGTPKAEKEAEADWSAIAKHPEAADHSGEQNPDYYVFTDLIKNEKFDPEAVTELKVETLQEGTGEVVKETDTVKANYTGWNSKGIIFDTTKKTTGDAVPVEFPLSGVIKGWTQGLTGQKVGGIYKLTIPADLAYGGVAGQGPTTGPLVFVVEIVSATAAADSAADSDSAAE
ncbi:MAG: FKBP-type peptidyl-prolyl cis-trans isomerase [Lactobacillales bacterium]|jgi:FKBP-type peptidyl-prolyl cis-trans isomerase|nr:FKBP-type peptidyl-prolyl cis-trans isomerase [Lactobacillales bacterium]